MIPGETILGTFTSRKCPECNEKMKLTVLHSAAGWYIGYACIENGPDRGGCGPYSRETGYYPTEQLAWDDLTEYKKTGELERERFS